jgi:hypothetical protein
MSRFGSLEEGLKEVTPKSHIDNQCEANDNQDTKDPPCNIGSQLGSGKLYNIRDWYDLALQNIFLIFHKKVWQV